MPANIKVDCKDAVVIYKKFPALTQYYFCVFSI